MKYARYFAILSLKIQHPFESNVSEMDLSKFNHLADASNTTW